MELLNKLYDSADESLFLTLWSKTTSKTQWIPVGEISSIAIPQNEDIFFGVGLANKINVKGRMTADDVVGIPGLWIDLDMRDDKHPNNPETVEEMLAIADSLPWEPSDVIFTGHGVHLYFIFKEFFLFESEADYKLAGDIIRGFQSYIRSRLNFKVDATHDLSRVMRLPGSVNHKSSPITVQDIYTSESRYNISDFEEYALAEDASQDKSHTRFKRNPTDRPAADSINACAFLRHCRDDATTLPEPEWTAMITNIARCSDGPATCHELSKPYPKYSYAETEKKILHALNDMQAQGCSFIRANFGFQCPSEGCGVKAPCGHSLTTKKTATATSETDDLSEPIPPGFFDGNEVPGIQHLTDMGNSERFAEMYHGKITFCNQMGKWLIWNGKVWKTDETLSIYQYAKDCIRSMHMLTSTAPDAETAKLISKFANASEGLKNVNSMLTLARAELPSTMDQLDGNRWLLNCQNGVINLKTGELMPHSSEQMHTKMADAQYYEDADAPIFRNFIESVFDNNQEVISFMQRFLGYCMTGDTREQQFVIAFGSGRNGKGTLLNLILDIMGNYACTTPPDTIYKKNTERISNDIARLAGARFVLISEGEENKRFDEPLIKKMTGQDRMSARFLYKEDFEFMPQFKLCLMTNDKPRAKAEDTALWARIQLVPFEKKFEGAKQDKNLGDKLRSQAEKNGILKWMVEGCLMWQRDGLNPPAEVLQATKDYQMEVDKIQEWSDDCCLLEPGAKSTISALYECYKGWNAMNGYKYPETKQTFTKNLEKKFSLEKVRTGASGRGYKGIGLLDTAESFGRVVQYRN